MTRETIPPLSSETRAFLERERELPDLTAAMRTRAMTRARAALLAAGPRLTFRAPTAPPPWRAKLRWGVAIGLTCLASAAVGATAYRLHDRWRSVLHDDAPMIGPIGPTGPTGD